MNLDTKIFLRDAKTDKDIGKFKWSQVPRVGERILFLGFGMHVVTDVIHDYSDGIRRVDDQNQCNVIVYVEKVKG